MTIFGKLFEQRNIQDPKSPLTSTALVDYLMQGETTHSGVSINQVKALNISSVWRAVNTISGIGASLPIKTYKNNTRELVQSQLIQNPHPSMTPFEVWEFIYVSLLLWGNAYLRKIRKGAGQQITALHPINPSEVRVAVVEPNAVLPSGKLFHLRAGTDREEVLSEVDVLHIPGLGYDGITGLSPIRAARQSLGLAMAAEEYGARLYGNGSLMSGVLQTEQRMSEEQATDLKRRFTMKTSGLQRSHEVAVLDSGAKFQPISINPADAQFLESRKFQIIEVARWFGLPPHMLYDVEKSTSWGSGIEEQGMGFVIYTMQSNWLTRVEQRLTKEATPYGIYAKYSVDALMRGNSAARAAFYQSALQNGWMNRDEVREEEDRPPLPDGQGQTYMQPLNMGSLGGNSNEQTPQDQPTAADGNIDQTGNEN